MAKKILFINQEMLPFVPETTLATMSRSIPQNVLEKGHEVRTFMPKWGNINERKGQLHEVQRLSGMNLIINDTDHPMIIKCASIPSTRIQVFFIDNEDYFSKRQMCIENIIEDGTDNGERAIFYARGVLETVKKQRWSPDIIHCQGWLSSLIPYLVKNTYNEEPSFANTKVVTSLFDELPQFSINQDFKSNLCATEELNQDIQNLEDMIKIAIDYSDGIIEATENINKDILEYAKGKGVPTLNFQDITTLDLYDSFYKSIE